MTLFRRETVVHDPDTDEISIIDTAVLGLAVKVRGEPEQYRTLELVETDAPTLMFVPKVYGDRVDVGDLVTWPPTGGREHTVRACFHVEPDGVVIASRVIVVR